jgi:hypothetical protein
MHYPEGKIKDSGVTVGAPRSPQRTRISCYAASDRTVYAAFFKESRMEFDNATNLDRKSGVRGTEKTGEAPPLLLP